MPREQITHNRIASSSTPPDVDGIPSATVNVEVPRRNVHVTWNHTGGAGTLGLQYDVGWVQIGIDVSVAELRSMLADAEREAETVRARLAEMGELDVEAYQFRVYSDVMDRAETNHAIRVLRRARAAAYGADE